MKAPAFALSSSLSSYAILPPSTSTSRSGKEGGRPDVPAANIYQQEKAIGQALYVNQVHYWDDPMTDFILQKIILQDAKTKKFLFMLTLYTKKNAVRHYALAVNGDTSDGSFSFNEGPWGKYRERTIMVFGQLQQTPSIVFVQKNGDLSDRALKWQVPAREGRRRPGYPPSRSVVEAQPVPGCGERILELGGLCRRHHRAFVAVGWWPCPSRLTRSWPLEDSVSMTSERTCRCPYRAYGRA